MSANAKSDSNGPSQIEFFPFAYSLYNENLKAFCWYCLDEQKAHKRCQGCGTAIFCDKNCQKLAWKDHKFECKALKSATTVPDIEVRLLGRIVTRYKAILSGKDADDPTFYQDRSSRRSIMDIWAHTKNISLDPFALSKFNAIYDSLTRFYEAKALLSKEIIFQLHCRDFINRHAISDRAYIKEIGKGLYLDLCAYDHSCRPNAIYVCDGFKATLRALNSSTNLLDRSATFYSYIDLLYGKQERRKLLRDTWYFQCECERCQDSSEHILISMYCPHCTCDPPERLCLFGDHPYKAADTQLITCPACGRQLAREEVVEALSAMRFVDDLLDKSDFEAMGRAAAAQLLEELLTRFARLLPRVNIYYCKIVQALIPLIDPYDSAKLLDLHLAVEECVRICYPHNHPALGFHLRNIGIFALRLSQLEKSIYYLTEAVGIFDFVMRSEHCLTKTTKSFLDDAIRQKESNSNTFDTAKHTAESSARGTDKKVMLRCEVFAESFDKGTIEPHPAITLANKEAKTTALPSSKWLNENSQGEQKPIENGDNSRMTVGGNKIKEVDKASKSEETANETKTDVGNQLREDTVVEERITQKNEESAKNEMEEKQQKPEALETQTQLLQMEAQTKNSSSTKKQTESTDDSDSNTESVEQSVEFVRRETSAAADSAANFQWKKHKNAKKKEFEYAGSLKRKSKEKHHHHHNLNHDHNELNDNDSHSHHHHHHHHHHDHNEISDSHSHQHLNCPNIVETIDNGQKMNSTVGEKSLKGPHTQIHVEPCDDKLRNNFLSPTISSENQPQIAENLFIDTNNGNNNNFRMGVKKKAALKKISPRARTPIPPFADSRPTSESRPVTSFKQTSSLLLPQADTVTAESSDMAPSALLIPPSSDEYLLKVDDAYSSPNVVNSKNDNECLVVTTVDVPNQNPVLIEIASTVDPQPAATDKQQPVTEANSIEKNNNENISDSNQSKSLQNSLEIKENMIKDLNSNKEEEEEEEEDDEIERRKSPHMIILSTKSSIQKSDQLAVEKLTMTSTRLATREYHETRTTRSIRRTSPTAAEVIGTESTAIKCCGSLAVTDKAEDTVTDISAENANSNENDTAVEIEKHKSDGNTVSPQLSKEQQLRRDAEKQEEQPATKMPKKKKNQKKKH